MTLPPFPYHDKITSRDSGMLVGGGGWSKWLNALRAFVNTLATDLETFQGGSDDVTFNADVFTASRTMTWGVTAGMVQAFRVGYLGAWMVLAFEIAGSTVGGTLSDQLLITLPDGKVAVGRQTGLFAYVDNGVPGVGLWVVDDASATLALFKSYASPAWSASVAATSVAGQALINVQDGAAA